jgi:hypothetical protein
MASNVLSPAGLDEISPSQVGQDTDENNTSENASHNGSDIWTSGIIVRVATITGLVA